MPERYFLDTCIWRDFYEDRCGTGGRPLGKYAAKLVMKILLNKDVIIFNDIIVDELGKKFDLDEIQEMFAILSAIGTLARVELSLDQVKEANRLGLERGIPVSDATHAISARENDAILVSQDKHFQVLSDIVSVKRPEDII